MAGNHDFAEQLEFGGTPFLGRLPNVDEDEATSDEETDDDEQDSTPVIQVGSINGQQINFPGRFDPDHSIIIEACLSNLRCGGNVLLECPSDNIRRLSTLLALLINQQHAMHEENDQDQIQLVPGSERRLSISSSQPIYYVTRSFDKIQEVINEVKKFKNTGYLENIRMAILAHPSQLCTSCKETSRCSLPSVGANDYRYRFIEPNGQVHDLSHIKKKGKSNKFCPFRYNTEILGEANFIFCSQEIIINSVHRAKYQMNLENAVIIFDDGGNIENACYAETSSAITAARLTFAGETFQSLSNAFRQLNQDQELQDVAENISRLSGCLRSFATAINVQARGKNLGSTEVLLDAMRSSGFARDPVQKFNENVKRALDFLETDDNVRNGVPGDAIDIKLFRSVQQVLSCFTHIHNSIQRNNTKDFVLEISNYVPKGAQPANTFKTCFVNLSAIIEPIVTPASSLIISSCCLPPTTVLRQEFLPAAVFDEEVIIPEQTHTRCFFAYCSEGPNGVPFKLDFQNQNRTAIHAACGEAILNVIHIIPKGVVVFFPSVPALERYVKCWKNGENREAAIWEGMENIKHIFCELDFMKAEDAKVNLDNFRQRCVSPLGNRTGALLLALHREKVSEVMDVQPGDVRCFVSLGIPFNSKQVPKMKAKEASILSAGDNVETKKRNALYYNAEAFHNQDEKFAHCIRKEQDWFVGLIFDDRMENKVNKNETSTLLPRWMQTELRRGYADFTTLIADLQEFVNM